MKEQKNIDRLYQEKFREFEASPSPELWKQIAQNLQKENSQKRLVPLWFSLSGAAAVVAILLSAGIWWFNYNPTPETTVVFESDLPRPEILLPIQNNRLTDTKQLLEELRFTPPGAVPDMKRSAGNSKGAAKEQSHARLPFGNATESVRNPTAIDPLLSVFKGLKPHSVWPVSFPKQPNGLTEKSGIPGKGSATDIISLEKMVAGLNPLESSRDEKTLSEKKKGWSLRPFAAPVRFDNLGRGNAIDPQFSDHSTTANLSMSYGLNFGYAVSNKVRIRSGIARVAMSYDIKNISISPGAPLAMANIEYSSKGRNLLSGNTIMRESITANTGDTGPLMTTTTIPVEVTQQFGFIEIPLEIQYKLMDRKVAIDLIAGGSSLLLNENAIFLHTGPQTTRVGKARNLNQVSFSSNIGLGMDYRFSETFSFNLEPVLKYQINTFSNAKDVQPYYFGVYSGFTIRF